MAVSTDIKPTSLTQKGVGNWWTNPDGSFIKGGRGAFVKQKDGTVAWDSNARTPSESTTGQNAGSGYLAPTQIALYKEYESQYKQRQTDAAIAALQEQLRQQQAAAALQVQQQQAQPVAPVVTKPVKVEPTVKTTEPVTPVTPVTPAATLPVTQPVTPVTTVTKKPATQKITPVDVTGTTVAPTVATPSVAPITATPEPIDQPRNAPSYYAGLGTPFDLNTLDTRVSGVEEYNTYVEELEGTNKRKRNQWTVSSQLGF